MADETATKSSLERTALDRTLQGAEQENSALQRQLRQLQQQLSQLEQQHVQRVAETTRHGKVGWPRADVTWSSSARCVVTESCTLQPTCLSPACAVLAGTSLLIHTERKILFFSLSVSQSRVGGYTCCISLSFSSPTFHPLVSAGPELRRGAAAQQVQPAGEDDDVGRAGLQTTHRRSGTTGNTPVDARA